MKVIKIDKNSSLFSKVKEIINQNLSNKCFKGEYFVLIKNNEIIGIIALNQLSWFITEIKQFVIIEKYRSKGYGQYLLKEVIKQIKTSLACCIVKENNYVSLHIFKKYGFKEIEKINSKIFMVKKIY
ncbi:MAG TPA: N-acetyltransferase [Candidatus Desulfofervidus auxilii]|uniref:N-acetyltransferase n=1 Tax=Desulfofervidus auxilii TaxID=1621989 RepID=A0A7C0Y8W2_DESA2|nr:N-acetyltransferase [Candidatus Desulfofervidus auxilii]